MRLPVIRGGRATAAADSALLAAVNGLCSAGPAVIVEDGIPETRLEQAPASGSLGDVISILLSSKSFLKFESSTQQKLLRLELKPNKNLGS